MESGDQKVKVGMRRWELEGGKVEMESGKWGVGCERLKVESGRGK